MHLLSACRSAVRVMSRPARPAALAVLRAGVCPPHEDEATAELKPRQESYQARMAGEHPERPPPQRWTPVGSP